MKNLCCQIHPSAECEECGEGICFDCIRHKRIRVKPNTPSWWDSIVCPTCSKGGGYLPKDNKPKPSMSKPKAKATAKLNLANRPGQGVTDAK